VNQMATKKVLTHLDMNSNSLLNVADGVNATDGINTGQLNVTTGELRGLTSAGSSAGFLTSAPTVGVDYPWTDTNIAFTMSAQDSTTLAIGPTGPIVFADNYDVTRSSISTFAAQTVPLSQAASVTVPGINFLYIGIDKTGAIHFSTDTLATSYMIAQLGLTAVVNEGGVITFLTGVVTPVLVQPSVYSNTTLTRTIAPLSADLIVYAATGLSLQATGDLMYGESINWPNQPIDAKFIPSQSPISFAYVTPAIVAGNTVLPQVTALDPTQYWNGTALATLPSATSASVQFLLLTAQGDYYIYYGSVVYPDVATAAANAAFEQFISTLPPTFSAIVCRIALRRDASDITNPADAIFSYPTTGGGVPAVTGVAQLIGTANQITASNPKGSVTLSLPQDIDPTASPTFNSVALTSYPTTADQAANVQYVQDTVAGINVKPVANAVATTNISLSGLQTVDGVALAAGDLVLVTGQTDQTTNGEYAVASGAWTRIPEMSTWSNTVSAVITIAGGTDYEGSRWLSTTSAGGTLGTTPINFVPLRDPTALTDAPKDNTMYGRLEGAWVQSEIDRPIFRTVANDSGATIVLGTTVTVVGYVNGYASVVPALADVNMDPSLILGVASEDIATGTNGLLCTYGPMSGLDTSSFALGVDVYLSPSTAGALTTTRPVTPNQTYIVGRIFVAATNGTLWVNRYDYNKMQNLSDVYLPAAPADSTVLRWSAADNYYEAVPVYDQSESDARYQSLLLAQSIVAPTTGNWFRICTWNVPSGSYSNYFDLVVTCIAIGSYASSTQAIRVAAAAANPTGFSLFAEPGARSGGADVSFPQFVASPTGLWGKYTGAAGRSVQFSLSVIAQVGTTNIVLAPLDTGSATQPSGTLFPSSGSLSAYQAYTSLGVLLTQTAGDARYLQGNQAITLSGDATGSGTTTIPVTFAPTGVAAGTYTSITVNAKGLVTAGASPTTLAGYGITDAQPLDGDLTAIAAISQTSGVLRKTAANTWTLDSSSYAPTNQTFYIGTTGIALNRASAAQPLTGITSIDGSAAKLTTPRTISATGDATWTVTFDGSSPVTAPLTLADTGVIPGTYNSATAITPLTIDSKGRITATGADIPISSAWSSITGTPTTVAGYGITDAVTTAEVSIPVFISVSMSNTLWYRMATVSGSEGGAYLITVNSKHSTGNGSFTDVYLYTRSNPSGYNILQLSETNLPSEASKIIVNYSEIWMQGLAPTATSSMTIQKLNEIGSGTTTILTVDGVTNQAATPTGTPGTRTSSQNQPHAPAAASTYTLSDWDNGGIVELNGACTVVIPTTLTSNFVSVFLMQMDNSSSTISGTFTGDFGQTTTTPNAQYGMYEIRRTSTGIMLFRVGV
jgi:phage-related tail fiber protein